MRAAFLALALTGCMPEVDMAEGRCLHPPQQAHYRYVFFEQEGGTCGGLADYEFDTGDDKLAGCEGPHGYTDQTGCVQTWDVVCPWHVEHSGWIDARSEEGALNLHRMGPRECRSTYRVVVTMTVEEL